MRTSSKASRRSFFRSFERARRSVERVEIARWATFFEAERRAVMASVATARHTFEVEALATGTISGRMNLGIEPLEATYQAVGLAFARRSFAFVEGKQAILTGATKQLDPTPVQSGIRAYITGQSGTKIRQINQETLRLVRSRLADSLDGTQAIRDIADNLDGLYLNQIIPNRSVVIARTEIVAASNLGSRLGAKETKQKLDHTWLATTGDLRTRPHHSQANGDRFPIDQAYVILGERLMFPGDIGNGATGINIIQCRCTEVFDPAKEPKREESPFAASVRREIGGVAIQTARHARRIGRLGRLEFEKRLAKREGANAARREGLAKRFTARVEQLRAAPGFEPQFLTGDPLLKELGDELTSLQVKLKGLQASTAGEMIAEVRATGGTFETLSGSSKVAVKALNKAAKNLPSDWITASNNYALRGGRQMRVVSSTTTKRGFYRDFDVTRADRTARATLRVRAQKAGKTVRIDEGNLYHEIGHRFEKTTPRLVELQQEFYRERTVGESLRSLPGYKVAEKGRPDEFFDVYVGKEYKTGRRIVTDPTTGVSQYDGPSGAQSWEILTMGQQSIFGGPGAFHYNGITHAAATAKDAEFFDFIWGLLLGG